MDNDMMRIGRGASAAGRANQESKDFERLTQKIEILLGERGPDTKPMSALRRGELVPLASLTMQSVPAAAAPTQAQYNALQADVKTIFDTLALISNRLGNANLPVA